MSSSCDGCFPYYQANQLAHIVPGGCLYDSEEMFCQPTNLESAFDLAAAEEIVAKSKEDVVECCICYETIGEKNNCVTECGHRFCFRCILKAMTRNTTCPYCRTELFEDFAVEESDYEESVDEEESEEDETEYFEENHGHAHIEDIVERLEKEGVTMLDVVSLLLDKFSTKDAKYTPEYITMIDDRVDQIEKDVEREAKEQYDMALEDVRV